MPGRMAYPLWPALEARAATGGELLRMQKEWTATGLSIDTRSLKPGELFVALKEARDGHEFLSAAANAGAAAALVDHVPDNAPESLPLLKVEATLPAMEQMAMASRDRHFGKRIAVTGSAGKTSVKEMLRAALSVSGTVHAAEKSFNNHLGVPLTLANMPPKSEYGIFEIGMNHPGEITPLVAMVRPHVAIITTVAAAHIEHFGSLDGIAAAKAEILTGLVPGGVAILPVDNPYYDFLCEAAREQGIERIIPFGESVAGETGVRLTGYQHQPAGPAQVNVEAFGRQASFTLDAPGRHQAVNATAVIGAAMQLGASLDSVIEGLSLFHAGDGRGATHVRTLRGATVHIIDESYNANPASMVAALNVLGSSQAAPGGRRVAVLGEMMELGANGAELHAALAVPVAEANVDVLFTAGEGMKALHGQLPAGRLLAHADGAEGLIDPLLQHLRDGDVVLFKGSNASRIGALLTAFLAKTESAE